MPPAQRTALFENTARSISGASAQVRAGHITSCTRCDPAYGEGVARAIAEPGRWLPGKSTAPAPTFLFI